MKTYALFLIVMAIINALAPYCGTDAIDPTTIRLLNCIVALSCAFVAGLILGKEWSK